MVFRVNAHLPRIRFPTEVHVGLLRRTFFWPPYYRWLIPIAFAVAAVHAFRRHFTGWLLIMSWFALQLATILVLRKVYWHYYYELAPGFALLFALGFERLLVFARKLRKSLALRPGQRLYRLLERGEMFPWGAALLLPLPILLIADRLKGVVFSLLVNRSAAGDLRAAIWPLATLLLAGSLIWRWDNRRKQMLLLAALLWWTALLYSSSTGGHIWWAASTLGVSACFTCGLAGWFWCVTGARADRLSNLKRRGLPETRNCFVILLWIVLGWLLLGQAPRLVRFGPLKSRLQSAQLTADYLRTRLGPGQGLLCYRSEITFLLGARIPSYWGSEHENVVARLGIAQRTGRELADVPGYCEKYKVEYVVLTPDEAPEPGRSREEYYICQHFKLETRFGNYVIFKRLSEPPA